MWRADLDNAALRLLRQVAADLAAAEAWLELPPGAWLPTPESRDRVAS